MARRLVLAVLLIVLGLAGGLVLTGRLRVAEESSAGEQPAAATRATGAQATSPAPFARGVPGDLPDFEDVAARTVRERGAKSVSACATHAVLSGPAIERIRQSPLEELVLLDTIALPPEKQIEKIKVLSVAPVLAEAVARIYSDKPVSTLFV